MFTFRAHSASCAAACMLFAMVACGGGGGKEEPKSNNRPPTVVLVSPTGSVTTENNYVLTFKASASDPDVSDTIDRFEWDFGDGTAVVSVKASNDPNGTATHAFSAPAGVAKSFTVQVRSFDNSNAVSTTPGKVTVTIPANAGPKATISAPQGTMRLGPGESYMFRASLNQASLLPGVSLKAFVWNFGDGSAPVVVNASDNTSDGAVSHAFPSNGGTYSVTVAAVNSLDNTGVASPATSIEVNAAYTNLSPVITVTTPASTSIGAYTTQPFTLAFSLQDGNNDTVTYTVDWGDGSPMSTNSVTGTSTGKLVSLQHVFADSVTTGTVPLEIRVNATDNRSLGGQAAEQTRTVNLTYNALPTATILTPQASGTLPSADAVRDGGSGVPVLPPTASDPDVVVIPANGKLSFMGTGTPPSSGGSLTYQWTFQGGSPSTSSQANAGEVFFAGVPNETVAYLVELSVKDAFGRISQNAVKARRKWVVVDGANTQSFNLKFNYLKKADNNGSEVITVVSKPEHGLNASIQIFQDGQVNSYLMADTSKTRAEVSVPVRSNLPFYLKIPKFGPDNNVYLIRIPNKPGVDPALSATPGFLFQNASAPWNPTLSIITSQGFADENAAADRRTFVGTVGLPYGPTPPNVRWVDRLSAPGTDTLAATTQWVQKSNSIASYSALLGYKNFAEWLVAVRTEKVEDPQPGGTTPNAPGDLGFVLNYPAQTAGNDPATKYPQSNAPSLSQSATHLDVFRVPSSNTEPYDVDKSNATGVRVVALNPTYLDATVRDQLFRRMLYDAPGSLPLAGGINQIPVPYNAADDDRVPDKNTLYGFGGARETFGYSEYLWSKVWARPLVLNRTNVGWVDMYYIGLGNYTPFRYSNVTTGWPALSNIPGASGMSALNFNVSAGATFDPSASPARDDGGVPDSTGIGHFYWTAFSPDYSAAVGATISRTWLADGSNHQPPVSFGGSASDPTSVLGFLVPLDPKVDKRGRDAMGQLNGQISGGYRISWFNPTRSASGSVVPPDFWVVVLETSTAGKQHFLLPANFPATQTLDAPILTDCRTFLPSGNGAYTAGDKAGAGYCWFDVPPELRPATGTTATLTVFAVRSIAANQAANRARPLNRTDWIEAVKTNTANVVITHSGNIDLSYGHKVPFNYPWDIVVANGEIYTVNP